MFHRETYAATAADLAASHVAYTHSDLQFVGATHQFEIMFGSTPATAQITITPLMAGGTFGTVAVSSTNTSNAVYTIIGVWDRYLIDITWTGTPESVKINTLGSIAVIPPAS